MPDHTARDREFTDLVIALSAQLCRTVYLICQDAADADDLVQETWERTARHWSKIRRTRNPGGYIYRIAVNLAVSERRQFRRRSDRLVDDDRLGSMADPRAAKALTAFDDRSSLASALAGLTNRQRAVLVLRYWQDLSEADVAELLGCSVGNVKSTASRALDAVRAAHRERTTTGDRHD